MEIGGSLRTFKRNKIKSTNFDLFLEGANSVPEWCQSFMAVRICRCKLKAKTLSLLFLELCPCLCVEHRMNLAQFRFLFMAIFSLLDPVCLCPKLDIPGLWICPRATHKSSCAAGTGLLRSPCVHDANFTAGLGSPALQWLEHNMEHIEAVEDVAYLRHFKVLLVCEKV
jgi:hypothetical protein